MTKAKHTPGMARKFRSSKISVSVDIDIDDVLSEFSDDQFMEAAEARNFSIFKLSKAPVNVATYENELLEIRDAILHDRIADAVMILDQILRPPRWDDIASCEKEYLSIVGSSRS